MFSKAHLPFWKERIRSCRSGFAVWIAEYEAGKKTLLSPLPSFSHSRESAQRYRICFGCKKVDTGMKRHECESEEKLKKTVEMYKKILKEEEDVVVEEDEPPVVPPSSEEMEKLEKEVKKLQRELRETKVKLEAYQNKEDDEEEDELQKKADKSDAYKSALRDVFRDLERHEEIYKDIRGLFEDYYPSLIEDV